MKKELLKKLLLALFVVLAGVSFTACSEKEEEPGQVFYTYGFTEFQSSSLGAISEMYTIESAFKSALGIQDTPFSMIGSVKECDAKVKAGCEKAADSLKDYSWNISGKFEVINVNTGDVVYTFVFSK